jgi:hypothetical protein
MKRLVAGLVIAVVLAIPAVVVAGVLFPPDNDFQGRIEGDPNTYLGFDKAHHKVGNFAMALPLNCYSGDRGIAQTTLDKRFRLQRVFPPHSGLPKALRRLRVFFGAGPVETDTAGSGSATVFGLLSPHRRPQGEVDVTTHGESFGKCYSGRLDWNVRRGAHVTLPPPGP